MEIRGLSNPLASLFGQRPTTDATRDVPVLTPTASTDAATTTASVSPLGSILVDYDLHQITPKQFTELLDRLQQADVLTPREHQQLGQLRLELDSAGVKSDEPIDLLSFLGRKLEQLKKSLEQAQHSEDDAQVTALEATLKLTQDQSQWLAKLDAARRERPPAGLDARA